MKKSVSSYVGSIVIDVNDVQRMRDFWRQVLDYRIAYEGEDWIKLTDPDERGATVSLQKVPEPREGKNRLHIDLYAPEPAAEVDRVRGLGASVVRERGPDDDFVVLADPEGNLFCIVDQAATG